MSTIGEIIAKYRKANHMSQIDLANELHAYGTDITQKAVSKWETDKSDPGADNFMAISKILGITNAYEEYWGINPSDPLSGLNSEGKEKVTEYIELLLSSGKYTKKKDAVVIPFPRRIRLYDIPVSAGTGNFTDTSEYDEIDVGAEVPEAADYGVHISGDSMEPQFVNGQIVWVHKDESLVNGDIGIFFLDGNVYIKKLQDDSTGVALISLNENYAPIPVSENSTFKVLGKVVG